MSRTPFVELRAVAGAALIMMTVSAPDSVEVAGSPSSAHKVDELDTSAARGGL